MVCRFVYGGDKWFTKAIYRFYDTDTRRSSLCWRGIPLPAAWGYADDAWSFDEARVLGGWVGRRDGESRWIVLEVGYGVS